MDSLPSTSTVRHFSRLPDRPPPSKWTHLTLAGAQFYCPLSQRPSRWPLHHALHAFLRIHDPEVLDDLESAALRLGDVHVHPEVMLAGHHFSWAARPLRDLCVIQCFDDVVLLQRAGLFDGSLPEP